MARRPVDRGFCRMGETKVPFHPVKSRFGRTKLLIAKVQAQASRRIAEARHLYFATRKTPLNSSRVLQRSTKGVT